MDGFALIKQIRQADIRQETQETQGTYGGHGPPIPIIVSSASVFDFNQEASLEAGANTFLPKPIQVEELLNQIRAQCQLDWIYGAIYPEPKASQRGEQTLGARAAFADASMVVPDLEVLAAFQDLALRGNLRGITRQAQALGQENQDYGPFAQHLQALAQAFEEEELIEFISQFIPTSD
jgi:CheY-like chemotaxis protein